MAEYYPLISRAVAGLRTGTPEARQAIYERARQALVGQLRAMDPPVPEDAIARETAALDEAIARTEAECRSKPAAPPEGPKAPGPTPSASPSPRPPLRARTPLPPPAAPSARAMPTLGGAQRAPSNAGPTAPAVLRPPMPVRSEPTSTETGRPKPARPFARTAEIPPSPPPPPPPIEAPAAEAEPTLPAATTLTVEPVGPAAGAEPSVAVRDDDEAFGADGSPAHDRARDEGVRPAAPRPLEARRSNLRVWIVAAVALTAVVAIGVTAWRLRDNPQELARAPAVVQPSEPTAGKIVERADGSAPTSSEAGQGTVVASDQATQGATEPAAAPPPAASSSQPAPQTAALPGTSPATSSQPSTPAAAPIAPPPSTNAPANASPASAELPIPVAYKAAILIDAPDTPEKVKTYVGTVVWHATSVPQGQGQPLATEIQANIDIPEAKTQLTMQIRRNTEAQLPASHTMDLKFTQVQDGPLGTIKQINVPQMRQPDMPTGDPLAGIPVTIADNYFLIGLMRGTAEERNLELLRSRQWFDIPMLLANGKASKITFEKGASGDKIFTDVLDSWKNAQNGG